MPLLSIKVGSTAQGACAALQHLVKHLKVDGHILGLQDLLASELASGSGLCSVAWPCSGCQLHYCAVVLSPAALTCSTSTCSLSQCSTAACFWSPLILPCWHGIVPLWEQQSPVHSVKCERFRPAACLPDLWRARWLGGCCDDQADQSELYLLLSLRCCECSLKWPFARRRGSARCMLSTAQQAHGRGGGHVGQASTSKVGLSPS